MHPRPLQFAQSGSLVCGMSGLLLGDAADVARGEALGKVRERVLAAVLIAECPLAPEHGLDLLGAVGPGRGGRVHGRGLVPGGGVVAAVVAVRVAHRWAFL